MIRLRALLWLATAAALVLGLGVVFWKAQRVGWEAVEAHALLFLIVPIVMAGVLIVDQMIGSKISATAGWRSVGPWHRRAVLLALFQIVAVAAYALEWPVDFDLYPKLAALFVGGLIVTKGVKFIGLANEKIDGDQVASTRATLLRGQLEVCGGSALIAAGLLLSADLLLWLILAAVILDRVVHGMHLRALRKASMEKPDDVLI